MAITDKEQGVWETDQVYNKIMEGDIWEYDAMDPHELWNVGAGYKGNTAQNDRTNRSSPVQVPGSTWAKISSGGDFALAIKTDNTLWSWGSNEVGELGQNQAEGNLNSASSPTQIPGTTWSVVSTSNGNDCAAAIKTDGSLWTWGGNTASGNLGLNESGYNAKKSSPTQIPGSWSKVSIADYCCAGVRTNGTLWTWGRNYRGALGHNTNNGNNPWNNSISSPTQIPGTNWSKVGSGNNGCAIKTDGTLWMWGQNDFGQLGQNGPTNTHRSSPVQIPGTTWKDVIEKNNGVAGLKTDGTLWWWGRNNDGAAGLNYSPDDRTGYSSPAQIPGSWGAFAHRGADVIAVRTNGTLWNWGTNGYGRLGQNSLTYFSSPVQVPGTDWAQEMSGVAAGPAHYYFKLP